MPKLNGSNKLITFLSRGCARSQLYVDHWGIRYTKWIYNMLGIIVIVSSPHRLPRPTCASHQPSLAINSRWQISTLRPDMAYINRSWQIITNPTQTTNTTQYRFGLLNIRYILIANALVSVIDYMAIVIEQRLMVCVCMRLPGTANTKLYHTHTKLFALAIDIELQHCKRHRIETPKMAIPKPNNKMCE